MDSELDEILSTTSLIMQAIKGDECEFNERFSKYEILYDNLLFEFLTYKELQESAKKLEERECLKFQEFQNIIGNNSVDLKKLENEVINLKEQKSEKEKELAELERAVENEKKNIASTLNLKDEINKKKDQILTYKLLTKTSFLYTGKKITGYVASKTPKTFTFDPQELSQEEITENLWKLITDENNINKN